MNKSKIRTGAERVVVILGHPRRDSYCGSLAAAYSDGAREAGAEVRFIALRELDFETDVVYPSPCAQILESDLERCRCDLEWAEHLVLVFPVWWATMPALLKGFLDRILLPGFAFRVDENAPKGYAPLLSGRSAQLITTMDSPAWVYRWIYGRPGDRAMKGAILGFCGIRPVKSHWVCKVKHLDAERRNQVLEECQALGRDAPGFLRRLGKRRRVGAWLRAMRLQFYAMTLLAYGMGAAAMVKLGGADFSWPVFVLGFTAIFLLEMASVFLNEYHDYATDERNRNAGPFTGGSRALVDGHLSPESLRRGARRALGASLIALGAFFAVRHSQGEGAGRLLAAGAFMGLGYLLGPGYTVPPLRLVYRGWGEVVVAFTHSPFMLLCGWLAFGGGITDTLPWLLSLPMGLSVFAAISLAGVPDADADRFAGKRTLAVRCSPRGVARIAILAVVAALASIPLIGLSEKWVLSLFDSVAWPLGLHGAFLVALIGRYLRSGGVCRRIDGILFVALSFILWFCLTPLIALL